MNYVFETFGFLFQEHFGFFKLNQQILGSAESFAKRAGAVLSTIQNGICGASFRPLNTGGGNFDWVFKVQILSTICCCYRLFANS